MPKGIRNKPAPVVAPAPAEVIAPVAIVEPVEAPEVAPVEVIGAVGSPTIPTIVLTNHQPDMSRVFVVEGSGKVLGPIAPAEDLAAYAKRIERAAQPMAVCIITHPDAVDGAIFEGVYAGIRLVNGPGMSARLSDGNTI